MVCIENLYYVVNKAVNMAKSKRFCKDCGVPIWNKNSKDYTKGIRCPTCRDIYRTNYKRGKQIESRDNKPYSWVNRIGGRGDSEYKHMCDDMKISVGTNVNAINSRLMIRINTSSCYLFFYDIGIKALADPCNASSKFCVRSNNQFTQQINKEPRYLEDFMLYYGSKNVKVLTPVIIGNPIPVDNKLLVSFLKKYKALGDKNFKATNEAQVIKVNEDRNEEGAGKFDIIDGASADDKDVYHGF